MLEPFFVGYAPVISASVNLTHLPAKVYTFTLLQQKLDLRSSFDSGVIVCFSQAAAVLWRAMLATIRSTDLEGEQ